MRGSLILATVALGLGLASGAQAADDQAPAASGSTATAQAASKPQPVKEKKVCRTEQATGSLIRANRICMTQAEWDQLEVQTQKDLNDVSRRVQVKSSGPFGG